MSRPQPDPHQIPLAVYIHIPYCLKKCPYCDFNSHARQGELPETAYLEAVCTELMQWAPRVRDRRIRSVFFGGGTPSLFTPAFYAEVLKALEGRVGLSPNCEISLEANPGASEAARFAGFRKAGVNRLSIGVQSLDNARLSDLGRVHTAADAQNAVASARQAGFSNLNLDLMFGLPHQSPLEAEADLARLLELKPEHIALYQLTLEPGTVFAAQPPSLPDPDEVAETEARLRGRLAKCGFPPYEVSNHAPSKYQCRHNRNYWEYGDYLGLGAGAHGKISLDQGILRTRNYAGPEAYIAQARQGTATAEATFQDDQDCIADFALNALRLKSGVSEALFPQRTGLPLTRLTPIRERAEAEGLLEPKPDALIPTVRGQAFLNNLVELFLAAA